jgi:GDPmannose 4,6-dehydratase
MKRAMITGITGQDGSYLAEHLLAEGYETWGLVHGHANPRVGRVRQLLPDIRLVYGDLLDAKSVLTAVDRVQPEEVYNLAAVSFIPTSWQHAESSAEVTGLGVLRLLEAVRSFNGITGLGMTAGGQTRFFQASSSEIFGDAAQSPQSESTAYRPNSPHGSAKLYGHLLVQHYRESLGMYAASGILFNHESPRRDRRYVSRKVSLGVAGIKLGLEKNLRLGSLSSRRDWGFAGDYVRAFRLMLQQDEPTDFVIGTGITHSVEELVDWAFSQVGLNWRDHVLCDSSFLRPSDLGVLSADSRRAHDKLGWQPTVNFHELVAMMVDSDLRSLSAEGDSGQF